MNPFVVVIIIVCGFVIFPSIVICCVSSHRKPLSHPRDLENGNIGTKDGGLVVLSGNDATTAAAVTTADSGGGDYNGCCCGGGDDGGDCGGGEGGSGGCGGDWVSYSHVLCRGIW